MNAMNACRDCKFFNRFSSHCERNTVITQVPDLVNGGTKSHYSFGRRPRAVDDRERPSLLGLRCGPKGRYFQPKETP